MTSNIENKVEKDKENNKILKELLYNVFIPGSLYKSYKESEDLFSNWNKSKKDRIIDKTLVIAAEIIRLTLYEKLTYKLYENLR